MTTKEYQNALDKELLEKLENDEEAFNEIFKRYHRLVYYIAYGMCKNDADAKDIVQEVFLKVKKSASDIRDKTKFKAWLNIVTISSCKDMFKRNKNGNVSHQQLLEDTYTTEERRYMLPEKQMHYASDQELLLHYISKLPENQRIVLMMQYFDNMTIQDIAETLNLSQGTVKSRLHYAKEALRSYIEQHNRNEKNKPLDFQTMDALIPGVLTYAGLAKAKKFSLPSKLWKANPLSFSTLSVACAIAGVVGVSGYGWLQTQKQQENLPEKPVVKQQIQAEVANSKELYFYLMDWAATKADMENKTAQEIEEIQSFYEQLKARDDEYYKLLKKVDWITYYEDINPI